jgi:hypothetical protein
MQCASASSELKSFVLKQRGYGCSFGFGRVEPCGWIMFWMHEKLLLRKRLECLAQSVVVTIGLSKLFATLSIVRLTSSWVDSWC